MELLPTSVVDSLLAALPEADRRLVKDGLRQLELPAAKLGIEVLEVEEAGIAFADAARLETRYSSIARVHFGMLDLLQFEVPAPMRNELRTLLKRMLPADFGPERRALFRAARSGGRSPEAALVRFLLYEAVLLNVVLATWDGGEELEAGGCFRELEREAEQIVKDVIDDPELAGDGAHPLEFAVSAGLTSLLGDWDQRAPELSRCTSTFRESFDRMVEASRIARAAGAHDAAVLRAAIESGLGDERVGSQRVVDRHPLLFTNTDAVDQRRSRLSRRFREGIAHRSTVRVIDFLLDTAPE